MVAAQRLEHGTVATRSQDAFDDHMDAVIERIASHHVDQADVPAARDVALA